LIVLSMLTINIGAASPDRARMLLDWLASRPEDVFILTETSAGPGTAYLLDRFRGAGFGVIKTPDADGERGSALVSRVQVHRDLTPEFAGVSIPCRTAAGVLDTDPEITVLGVYVPSRDRSQDKTERKRRFIGSLLDAHDKLPASLAKHLVIGGDYNVIARTHQPLHPGFLPFEFGLLETLRSRGLADAFEAMSPGVPAYSWIGRTGDGYRYDYLHVAPALTSLIGGCDYLHETRQRKLSDHAALTLTLHAEPGRLATGDPAHAAVDGTAPMF
jgi:exodeoxyribonuclease III